MGSDWTTEYLEKHIIGKMKAVTIPVNFTIRGKQRFLDLSEVETLLRKARVISQEECECRMRIGNCLEPMDGCLSLNEEAIKSIETRGTKKITVEQALEALRRTHDAGFVHTAYTFTGENEVGIICSCCSCCCHSLSAVVRFGYSDHVFTSKFIACQDPDRCTNCGTCVDRCQFGVREHKDGQMLFMNGKCFGCGLCLRTCPEGAINLVPR